MQNPDIQKMVDGLTETGTKALDAGDIPNGLLAGGVSGLIVALATINATLEEIRDAITQGLP